MPPQPIHATYTNAGAATASIGSAFRPLQPRLTSCRPVGPLTAPAGRAWWLAGRAGAGAPEQATVVHAAKIPAQPTAARLISEDRLMINRTLVMDDARLPPRARWKRPK